MGYFATCYRRKLIIHAGFSIVVWVNTPKFGSINWILFYNVLIIFLSYFILPMKQFNKQRLIAYISSAIPFSFLSGVIKSPPLIGYYHLVSDEEVPHIKHLYLYKSIKQFKDDLEFLLKRFRPICLTDFLTYMKTGRAVPDNAFLLTFDDGLRETHDVIAPILFAKGVPAAFFLCSAFVDNEMLAFDHKKSLVIERFRKVKTASLERNITEILLNNGTLVKDIEVCLLGLEHYEDRVLDEIAVTLNLDFREYLALTQPYITSDQVKQMITQGFVIGAHSIDHPRYSSLSLDQQLHQTRVSIEFIRETFGLKYAAFAFPHSDHGISNNFFKEVHRSQLIDISFGTAGILGDAVPTHFQRFSLEKPLLSAEKILAYQLARRTYRSYSGNDKVLR